MNDPTTNSSFHTYLGIVRRRWLLMTAVVLACAAVGLVQVSRQTPQYQAVSQILLDQMIIPSNGGLGVYLAERQLENDLAFANSPLVGQKMADQIGYRPAVQATSVNADVVSFTAVSTNPAAAATEANLFAETFIVARRERLLDSFTAAITERDGVIADLQAERTALDLSDPAEAIRKETLDSQIAGLIVQRDELRLSSKLQSAGGATVIAPAVPPTAPFAPDRSRTVALALTFGLACAAAAAWVRERFDDTIRTRDDLDRASHVSYLGALPRDRSRAAENPAFIAEHGPLDEAFRSLRTSVQFAGLRQPLRSVQITSANSAEGKTTTASYLAVAMAQAGERVVLIDGDLRNPNLHQRFGLAKAPGLSDLLLGTTNATDAYSFVATGAELWVVPCGEPVPNPANFLWAAPSPADGPSLLPYVRELIARGYLVVIDSPPTLPVADALTLSHMVDGTLFVVAAGKTRARDVSRAMEQLEQADATLIGTVLNGLTDPQASYGYKYGYGSNPRRARRTFLNRPRRPAQAHRSVATPNSNNGFIPRPSEVDLREGAAASTPREDELTAELRALVGTMAEPTRPGPQQPPTRHSSPRA